MSTIPNLSDREKWPDKALDELRLAILTEKDRRSKQDYVPSQISDLARNAVESGCDPQQLIDAVTEGVNSPRVTPPST